MNNEFLSDPLAESTPSKDGNTSTEPPKNAASSFISGQGSWDQQILRRAPTAVAIVLGARRFII